MIFPPDFSKRVHRKQKEQEVVAERRPAPEYPKGNDIVEDVGLDVLIPDFEVSPIEPDEEYFGSN